MAKICDLTPQDIGVIKHLLDQGELQHRISAMFDINMGRISEIKTGKRFADVPATPPQGDRHA